MEHLTADYPNFIYDDETKNEMLNEIRELGKEKPLGSMPLDTLTVITGKTPNEEVQNLESKGLKAIILPQNDLMGGALYSYNEMYLKNLLQRHESTLQEEGWPTTPAEFVEFAHNNIAKGSILKILSEAYSDTDHM